MAGLSEFKKLRDLTLDSRLLTADSLRALAELPELTNMQIMNLGPDHNLSLAGLAKLYSMYLYGAAQLKPADYRGLVAAPNLTQLHIYQGELTSEHFEELKRIPTLKGLVLQETKTTQSILDQFKSARPDVAVTIQGGQIQ